MKKVIIIAILSYFSFAYALTNAQIEDYYKSKIPIKDLVVKVLSKEKLKEYKGLEVIRVELSSKSRGKQTFILFTDNRYIFPDVLDPIKKISLKKTLQKSLTNKQIAKLYKNEKKENIVVLGNDKNKDTIIEFTDPECPYCNRKIKRLENDLRSYNIKLIFTPVHQRSSLEKSAIILRETKKAKDDKDKIKIIRKYYGKGKKVDQNVTNEEVNNIKMLKKRYLGAGIRGVPYIVKESELKKYYKQ